MFRLAPLLVLICTPALVSAGAPLPAANIPAVDSALQAFAAQKDLSPPADDSYHFSVTLDLLRAATDAVFQLDDSIGKNNPDPLIRQNKTRALLLILQAIDQAEDSKFDPNAPAPDVVVNPPELSGQSQTDYEAAVVKNNQEKIRYYRETELRRFQNSLQQEILAYIAAAYSGDPSAPDKLTQLATATDTDQAFAQKLRQAVTPGAISPSTAANASASSRMPRNKSDFTGLSIKLASYPSPAAAAHEFKMSYMMTQIPPNRQETFEGLTLYIWDGGGPIGIKTLAGNYCINIYASPSTYPFVFADLKALLAKLPGSSPTPSTKPLP